jgi:hypothetical protein
MTSSCGIMAVGMNQFAMQGLNNWENADYVEEAIY